MSLKQRGKRAISVRATEVLLYVVNQLDSLLHSEQPKLHRVLAILSAVGLKSIYIYIPLIHPLSVTFTRLL